MQNDLQKSTTIIGRNKLAPLSKFQRALEAALASRSSSVNSQFIEAYPDVEHFLRLELPQKIIIDQLNSAYGLKLHPKRFRELLQGERDRRSEAGEVLVCRTCGQTLNGEQPLSLAESADKNSSLNQMEAVK